MTIIIIKAVAEDGVISVHPAVEIDQENVEIYRRKDLSDEQWWKHIYYVDFSSSTLEGPRERAQKYIDRSMSSDQGASNLSSCGLLDINLAPTNLRKEVEKGLGT